MKLYLHCIFIACVLIGNSFLTEKRSAFSSDAVFYAANYHIKNEHKNFHAEIPVNTFAEVDAAADQFASTKKIFSFQEETQLRKSLEKQLESNSHNIALNWALMRFYASAPNFAGGSTSLAIQYAGYIYSLNQYLGCLAFEYVYNKRKELDHAESWYRQSLAVPLPKDMYWEEIIYDKTPHQIIKVTGNFNNWKTQNMYMGSRGTTYKRRIMVPKCETCIYKVIVDYTLREPSKKQLINETYW